MKYLLLGCLTFSAFFASAQATIKPVEKEVSKVKRVGYSTTTNVDSKIVEQAWKKKLAEYGRVLSERGDVYKVEYAKVPFYDKSVLLVSQLDTRRGETTLFLSADLGNYEYASSTNTYGRELENILSDFHKQIDYDSQVAEADKALQEANSVQKDVTRKSERNVRNLKDNRAEKIKLLKRLEENQKELLELQSDSTKLKTDVERAADVVGNQIKNLDKVKSRKP